MSHGPWAVRPTEVTRAIKAVEAAGKRVREVVIKDGAVRLITGEPDTANSNNSNEWDEVLKGEENAKVR